MGLTGFDGGTFTTSARRARTQLDNPEKRSRASGQAMYKIISAKNTYSTQAFAPMGYGYATA